MHAQPDRPMRLACSKTRSGSAILLCTVAAAVLSISGLAMIRSSGLQVAKVNSRRSAMQAQHVADGMVQRAIALLRENPAFNQTITSKMSDGQLARCEISFSKDTTAATVSVYLYSGARDPYKTQTFVLKKDGADTTEIDSKEILVQRTIR